MHLPAALLLVLFPAFCAASAARAQSHAHDRAHGGDPATGACAPRVAEAWIRLPPNAAMPMAAGFGRVENPCAQAVAVVAADSEAFAEVSIHESREVDGVSRMREIDRLPVAAGGSVQLQPGGLHLMLFRPHAPLRAGERLPVRLRLEDGRRIEAGFEVRQAPPAGDPATPAHAH